MVLSHSFYCSNGDCDNEVEHINEMCMDCTDTISDMSAHCAGCGEEVYAGASGYCGTCWTEKFSDDEEEEDHEAEIEELRMRLAFIAEKLKTNMTMKQTADWGLLQFKAMERLMALI